MKFGKHGEEILCHVKKCWEWNTFFPDILRYEMIRIGMRGSKGHESQEVCKRVFRLVFFPIGLIQGSC